MPGATVACHQWECLSTFGACGQVCDAETRMARSGGTQRREANRAVFRPGGPASLAGLRQQQDDSPCVLTGRAAFRLEEAC